LGLGDLDKPDGLVVWRSAAIGAGGRGLFDFWKDSVQLSLFGFVYLYDVADFNWVL
jgi:hypothetical protein